MEVKEFEGKELDSVIEEALEELNIKKEEAIIINEEISKGTLIKKKSVKIKVYTYKDIQNYLKGYLLKLTELMGLSVTFETKLRGEQIYIKMYSDNNSILIGKEGKTLNALQTLVRQIVRNKTNTSIKINLDVSNYKMKKMKNIERIVRQVAKEVKTSKVTVSLDPMNSYERRYVHTIISEYPELETESVGEGKERHITIKYKEI